MALGSTIAADNLTNVYWYGVEGIPEDEPRAMGYAMVGFKDDHPNSVYVMGMAYMKAITVEQDSAEALRYALKCAAQGNRSAKFLAGVIYYHGPDGVDVDMGEAARLFRAAAEAGHMTAAFNLGILYRNGEGAEADPDRAIACMEVALERGHNEAEAELERLRASKAEEQAGQDTPEVPQEAIRWYAEDQ